MRFAIPLLLTFHPIFAAGTGAFRPAGCRAEARTAVAAAMPASRPRRETPNSDPIPPTPGRLFFTSVKSLPRIITQLDNRLLNLRLTSIAGVD
jgi:hypothetical protein